MTFFGLIKSRIVKRQYIIRIIKIEGHKLNAVKHKAIKCYYRIGNYIAKQFLHNSGCE